MQGIDQTIPLARDRSITSDSQNLFTIRKNSLPTESNVSTVMDASKGTKLVNEPVEVSSTPGEIASTASQVSPGGASGSAQVPYRASENSSDTRYASISDDNTEETNTLPNEPVSVINSTLEEIVSTASQVSSGGDSGSAEVPDRASENSSDFRYASISDDNNTPQHASQEMTDLCNAGSDTEESTTQPESVETVSGPGSRSCSRRCLIILGVVLLLLIVHIIVVGIGLAIAYAILGEKILDPIDHLENTINEAGEALSSIFR